MFKTKILDIKNTVTLDKEGYQPGALIKEKVDGKPVGEPMRVIQAQGAHVLVNYLG
jgi:hypothetical protein